MIVVADTGPIISLAVIDKLSILRGDVYCLHWDNCRFSKSQVRRVNKRIETIICRNARQKKVLFCRVVK